MKLYIPNKLIPLYHISLENHNGEIFYPRIPEGVWDEDEKTPRICVSTSLVGCIRALDTCLWYPAVKWYVHVPDNLEDLYQNGSVMMPSEKEVGDVKTTREKWIIEPCKMNCIGAIKSVHGKFRCRFRWIK